MRSKPAIYVWVSEDGATTMEYPKENQARAAVIRKGGSYTKKG